MGKASKVVPLRRDEPKRGLGMRDGSGHRLSDDNMMVWLALPCISYAEREANYWSVQSTGNGMLDGFVGQQLALSALRLGRPQVITDILQGMIKRGHLGPAEISFCSVVVEGLTAR